MIDQTQSSITLVVSTLDTYINCTARRSCTCHAMHSSHQPQSCYHLPTFTPPQSAAHYPMSRSMQQLRGTQVNGVRELFTSACMDDRHRRQYCSAQQYNAHNTQHSSRVRMVGWTDGRTDSSHARTEQHEEQRRRLTSCVAPSMASYKQTITTSHNRTE